MEQEVKDLGFSISRTFSTGVELTGTVNDCIRLNLNLRCASQILYAIKTFKANSPNDVYDTLVTFPWEEFLAEDSYLSVTSTVDHFLVNNSMFINVKVKDAIVDRMRRERSRRPDSGSQHDGAVIHLYWREEQADLFIDTAGHTLSKHGYRKIPGKAPMLEALAAATIMATGWDGLTPFVNPMCGSGTVAIEAALFATNRKPGLFRQNYSFMHILGYTPDIYELEFQRLKEQVREVPGLKIIATDISADAVEISKVNAEMAGVEKLIQFGTGDFEETEIPEPPGIVYFNPEYGERMGEESELEGTYKRIGDFMKKKCQGYTGFVFTGNLELAKKIGLKASRRLEFYNSTLDCRLLKYDLYSGSKREPKVG
jgi:23S rRNA G2445 N2-methylase RlmL